MELAILGLGAIGCGAILLVLVAALAIQALFLHYGAKMAGVEAPYSKAFWAVLAVAIVNGVVQFALAAGNSPAEMELAVSNFLTEFLLSIVVTLVIGTIVVTWIYAIPVVRAFWTYLASMFLGFIFMIVVMAGVFGLMWAIGGTKGIDDFLQRYEQAYYEGLREKAIEEGIDPSTVMPPPVSVLDDVEFTEFDNAVDIQVADAREYIGKTVRVVQGPRRESIGKLKDVTATKLIVSVRISGGRIDEPIQKSKVTTFQWIPPG